MHEEHKCAVVDTAIVMYMLQEVRYNSPCKSYFLCSFLITVFWVRTVHTCNSPRLSHCLGPYRTRLICSLTQSFTRQLNSPLKEHSHPRKSLFLFDFSPFLQSAHGPVAGSCAVKQFHRRFTLKSNGLKRGALHSLHVLWGMSGDHHDITL